MGRIAAPSIVQSMEGGWLARLRWRRRGAWLWPAFAAFIAIDAVIGHALPATGESEAVPAAVIAALMLNLLGVLLLSRPLGALLRRKRKDLPGVVARNYAGTGVVVAVGAALLIAGLAHHSSIVANQRAMHDAITRAQAWIGDRAPPAFRRNAALIDTFAIQPGSVYRSCARSDDGSRSYCVIVDTQVPFPRGVRFDGYEPNAIFSRGVG
jgi:hypothetical protein